MIKKRDGIIDSARYFFFSYFRLRNFPLLRDIVKEEKKKEL